MVNTPPAWSVRLAAIPNHVLDKANAHASALALVLGDMVRSLHGASRSGPKSAMSCMVVGPASWPNGRLRI